MRRRSLWGWVQRAAGALGALALAALPWPDSSALGADTAPGAPAPKPFSLFSPQEISLRFAYGIADRNLDFFTFGPRVAYDLLPSLIPAIAGNRIRIGLETTGSIIHGGGHDHDGEWALSPLIFDYRYDTGGRFVPFFEGGEGIVLTTLKNEHIGGPFEFSSQFGGGLHVFFADEDAVTFGFRMRHISNSGIKHENSGLNTYFFTIGLSTFPGRR